jgi:hypothetical protein
MAKQQAIDAFTPLSPSQSGARVAYQRWISSRKFHIAFGINWMGAVIYLAVASQFWADPDLKEVPGASGSDPILWALEALPTLGLCLLGNIIWAIVELARQVLRRRLMLNPAFVLIPVIWLAAICIDFANH